MASIFIGASGAIMDLSVDITSAVCEVVEKKPGLGWREAVRSGMNVKDRQEKGQHRTQSCPSGKKDQQQDKHCRQQQFPWSTVVIDHGDTQYFPILIVDSDQCLVFF